MKGNVKRGFTLIELIIVIAILAILAAILVPSVIGYIKTSQEAVCSTNRGIIERQYNYIKVMQKDATLQKVLQGEYADFLKDMQDVACPAGGVYSVSEDGAHILCSIHDELEGDVEEPTVPPSSVVNTYIDPITGTSTGIVLDENGWPLPIDLGNQGYRFDLVPGGIFEYEGKYYVIPKPNTIQNYPATPENVESWTYTCQIQGLYSGAGYTNPSSWSDRIPINRGQLLNFNGSWYVCIADKYDSSLKASPTLQPHIWYQLP